MLGLFCNQMAMGEMSENIIKKLHDILFFNENKSSIEYRMRNIIIITIITDCELFYTNYLITLFTQLYTTSSIS